MKNKKVIKFQRKQMLISNPLQQPQLKSKPNLFTQHNNNNNNRVQKQSQSQSQLSSNNYPSIQTQQVNQKIQMPRQMKIQNICVNIKNKFIAMMDGQPIIKIDTLFENQIVCKITGNVANKNRQSFGKKNKQRLLQSQTVDNNSRTTQNYNNNLSNYNNYQNYNNNYSNYNSNINNNNNYMQQNIRIPPPPLATNIFQQANDTNYLDLISQGIPIHNQPLLQLQQAFQQDFDDNQWDNNKNNNSKSQYMANYKVNYIPTSFQNYQYNNKQYQTNMNNMNNMNNMSNINNINNNMNMKQYQNININPKKYQNQKGGLNSFPFQ